MDKMTPEEKAARARQRMIDKAREYTLGTYARQVATVFQRVIRAEAAARPDGRIPVVLNGEVTTVFRRVGLCVCVTCGRVGPWSGGLGGMHTGHFLASRCNSILFEEQNVAPQCSSCNIFRSGEQQLFRIWMLAVRGPNTVERLERLKAEVRQFTRDELVDMKIAYQARLKAAEKRMNPYSSCQGDVK